MLNIVRKTTYVIQGLSFILLLTLGACSSLEGPTGKELSHQLAQERISGEDMVLLEEEQTIQDESGVVGKNQVYYFDFDSSELHQNIENSLKKQAEYLLINPDKSLHLAGHTDERGSPEYNIALGWRRAKAISNFLKKHGIANKQLKLISFGSQKPAVLGHTETAWQKNRRVVITYLPH